LLFWGHSGCRACSLWPLHVASTHAKAVPEGLLMRLGPFQSWLFSLFLGLSYCCAAGAVEAAPGQLAGVTTVRQQDGRLGLVVPLSVRDGALRRQRRRLHNHGSIAPVLGAVREG